MKAIHAITIKNNVNDSERIGDDLKRKDKENLFCVKVEEIFEAMSPLPISFDVSCKQGPFFSEFTYQDVLGGIYLKSQNAEINARIMEQAVVNCENEKLPEDAKDYLADKYKLQEPECQAPEKVVFLPGSNFLGIENKEMLLPLLYSNPLVAIKPHPNMTPKGLISVAGDYGWDRIINPDISGYALLNKCKVAYSTANSEMGLIAAIIKKTHVDITSIFHFERLTYSGIHRLLQPENVDHNYKTVARIFNSTESGFIPPWAENIEERVDGFIEASMQIRKYFRPSFPDVKRWTKQITNINK
jgi:hypothetical protein